MTRRCTHLLPATALALACLAVLAVGLVRGPSDWVLTHYAFTYEDEFLKRALVGTVLRGLTVSDLARAAHGLMLASSACIALAVYTGSRSSPSRRATRAIVAHTSGVATA